MSGEKSAELIIYQLGEVKNSVENIGVKFDAYRDKTDARIAALEKLQVAQDILNTNVPKIDVQKIVLAAFGLVSAIVATALGIRQGTLGE